MPYWQLFYHFVWSTKNREPLLTPEVEPLVHGFLRAKAVGLGATVLALNGVADHVHLVAIVPPRLALATFIGQVKGVTSATMNKAGLTPTPFFWQEEYGVFSFDQKRLPNFVHYVEHQKQHHAQHVAIAVLERTDEHTNMLHEAAALYLLDDETWRRDLDVLDIQ
jgi:putative transposase